MGNESWTYKERERSGLTPLRGSKYPLIDAHLHFVDFRHETMGSDALLYYMDQANVGKAVICGLPAQKMWASYDREPPAYYLSNGAPCYYYSYSDVIVAEQMRALPTEQRQRFFPLINGFNPVDRYAVRHIERLYEQYTDVWRGIGEILLRHDDLSSMMYGEDARPNHPALWPVYEFAAEHDWPVLIHSNVTSVAHSDYPLYVYEIEEALREFPHTRFIFAHCGMSRRVNVPFYTRMVDRLLTRFPNVCVDISWVIFDVAICPNGEPNQQWLDLAEKWSSRICLGSDLVNAFEHLGPTLERYDPFLDRLSEEARANICWRTAEQLYGQDKRAAEPRHIPVWGKDIPLVNDV